ncbi:MAG: flagellin [Opitutales bacterium]
MGLVVNTNVSASIASSNLNTSNMLLQKSLNRLSSGNRITSPADDAGGLAVSMKLQAQIRRNESVDTVVNNAISFLQTQDGALSTATSILQRMSELRVLQDDPTKSTDDKATYNTEFEKLQEQLTNIIGEKFNGVALFADTATDLSVATTEDGATKVNISQASLKAIDVDASNGSDTLETILGSSVDLDDANVSVGALSNAIQGIATLRATNGAQTSQLQFASQLLTANRVNIEAANSRIIDTDVAAESTRFARANILVQSGAAMLAQANTSSQIALRLLG